MLAHTSNGQEGIVEACLVPILVEKLLEENDKIKVNGNANLYNRLNFDVEKTNESMQRAWGNLPTVGGQTNAKNVQITTI